MICPECAADLEDYNAPPDLHTHWCEDCGCGRILHGDTWISLDEAIENQWKEMTDVDNKVRDQ